MRWSLLLRGVALGLVGSSVGPTAKPEGQSTPPDTPVRTSPPNHRPVVPLTTTNRCRRLAQPARGKLPAGAIPLGAIAYLRYRRRELVVKCSCISW